jgi:hypothetical protein
MQSETSSNNPMGVHVVDGLNAHCDFDECPARGPYQIHGLSMRDNRGIIWANSEEEAVEIAQQNDADAFHATALNLSELSS